MLGRQHKDRVTGQDANHARQHESERPASARPQIRVHDPEQKHQVGGREASGDAHREAIYRLGVREGNHDQQTGHDSGPKQENEAVEDGGPPIGTSQLAVGGKGQQGGKRQWIPGEETDVGDGRVRAAALDPLDHEPCGKPRGIAETRPGQQCPRQHGASPRPLANGGPQTHRPDRDRRQARSEIHPEGVSIAVADSGDQEDDGDRRVGGQTQTHRAQLGVAPKTVSNVAGDVSQVRPPSNRLGENADPNGFHV